ncbi:MAG: hypothetical protein LBT73_03400 [Tannerellaceae bacterium]|jgi:hypothetical protein|nr:hypothetical protein [Tannerellaceae bacterium]
MRRKAGAVLGGVLRGVSVGMSVWVSVLLLASVPAVEGATYYVKIGGEGQGVTAEDACSLDKALEWSRSSDIIRIVEGGRYALADSGSICITKHLRVIGEVEGIVLKAGLGKRVVVVQGASASEPVVVEIAGVTIEGGAATAEEEIIIGAERIVVPAGRGGGIYTRYGVTTLRDVVVRGNKGSITGDGYGGGVYNADSSKVVLIGGRVEGNIATVGTGSGYGGGIYSAGDMEIEGKVEVKGNYGVKNEVSKGTGLGGGVLSAGGGKVLVKGVLEVRENVGTVGLGVGQGGGIGIASNTLFDIVGKGKVGEVVLLVEGNVGVQNSASKSEGWGGGIYVEEGEGLGLSDLRLLTSYAGAVEVEGNIGTTGLGKGYGGGIAIGVHGRVRFDGAVRIEGNYAIKNSQSTAEGSGGGVYRAAAGGSAQLQAPVIKDNIVTTGKGGSGESEGVWTLTLNRRGGFERPYSIEVYESLENALPLTLTLGEGFGAVTPRLCRDTALVSTDIASEKQEGLTYYYTVESTGDVYLYAHTSTRKIEFITNSAGVTFTSWGAGSVNVDAKRVFKFVVQKAGEKYIGGEIRKVSWSYVDEGGVRHKEELAGYDLVGDGYTLEYTISSLVCDSIWAEYDGCRIVLAPAPAGEGFTYREHTPTWKEGEEDVVYLSSGKEFMVKVSTYSIDDMYAPEVFVDGWSVAPRSRNSVEGTSTYYIPVVGESMLVEASVYARVVVMKELPAGVEFIPYGKEFYVLEAGTYRVSGDFSVAVQNKSGEMRDVVLLNKGAETEFIGKNYELKAYYYTVKVPKKEKDTIYLEVDYAGLNIVVFEPAGMYGALSIGGESLSEGKYQYAVKQGEALKFRLYTLSLRPSVEAISEDTLVALGAEVISRGVYEYTFPYTGGEVGLDTFVVRSTEIPHLSLYVRVPEGVELLDSEGLEVTEKGYRRSITSKEEKVSFVVSEYYRLAQPIVKCRGSEEYPARGQDTVTVILSNLIEDTEAEVAFLYHRLLFSITDPDIYTDLKLKDFGVAPGSSFEFGLKLNGYAPAVIVNGEAVIAGMEGDGQYRVRLENIKEDLEISVHKTAVTVSFLITDPGITMSPSLTALAIAPNNDLEFYVYLPEQVPTVMVNGSSVETVEVEAGKYKVVVPVVTQDLAITIHKYGLGVVEVGEQPGGLIIYSLRGVPVLEVSAVPSEGLPLAKGVYIVKEGARTYKVHCR